MSSVEESKKERYHHGRLRAALLEAALQLIDEQGLDALTLRRLARRVGVTHAAPYRHFRNKAELVAAVATQGFEQLAERLAKHQKLARATDRARPKWLAGLGAAYVSYARQHPAQFRIMFPTNTAAQHGERLSEGRELLWEQMKAAAQTVCDTGTVRRDRLTKFARLLWCQIHGVAMLCNDSRLPPASGVEATSATLINETIEQLWAARS